MTTLTGPITRRFAEKCADSLYMKIEIYKDRVVGKKRVLLDLGGVPLPVELEVKGWFGDTKTGGADAGLILQGPGSMGVALVRRQGHKGSRDSEEFLFSLLDIRDLDGGRPTIAKWWSHIRYDVVGSQSFLDHTDAANRGTFQRVKGVWSPV
jgi:hypothetical protein